MMLRRVIIFLSLVLVLSVTNISLMNAQVKSSNPDNSYLIIVNNDGSISKFNPVSKAVVWSSSLELSFIQFSHSNMNSYQQLNYVLPNFDGSFIFVSQRNRPIKIQRKQLEKLLNRCFDKDMKYFVYDSIDYYVLNIQTGKLQQLKSYLDEKNSMQKQNYVMRIDRKHLKSLNQKLEEKWSTISSQISILSVKQFTKDSKTLNQIIPNKYYKFNRKSGNSIQIIPISNIQQSFELESDSNFIAIFSFQDSKILKHSISNEIKRNHMKQLQGEKNESENFILTFNQIEYELVLNKKLQDNQQIGQVQFCVNSVRVLQNQSIKFKSPELAYTFANRVVDKEVSIASQLIIGGIVLVTVGICIGLLITKVKKQMLSQIQNNKSDIEKRIQQMQKQIQQTKSVSKNLPYTIKYQDLKRTHDDVKVYVSTILSKQAQVSIFPLHKHESIINKIETISTVNNKRLIKVWHHQIKQQQYLIFTDKIAHTLEDYLNLYKDYDSKTVIKQIIEMMRVLQTNSIKINCLSPSHIVINDDGQFKFNSLIPDNPIWSSIQILENKQPNIESNMFMLANIIYFVNSRGNTLFQFDSIQKEIIIDSFKKLKYTKKAEKDCEDNYVLNGLLINLFSPNDSKVDLNNIDNHVFFWDNLKSLSFVNQFSNYMQTHLDDQKVKKFETSARQINATPLPWSKQLPKEILVDVVSFRKYDFNSIRDIIRVIRNKSNHFHEVPQNVRKISGRTKQDLCKYYLTKFPRLLYFMYRYAQKKKWKLHGF